MKSIKRGLILAILSIAAVAPATADAHPHQLPVWAGKNAVRNYAIRIAAGVSTINTSHVYACRPLGSGNVACAIEFDGPDVTCTEPAVAYYASDYSSRISVLTQNKYLHCH